jgi:hypothetical protein
VLDMTRHLIGEQPLRIPLPAPVHCRNRKAAREQIGDGLEVFLDRLAAAGKHTDGSSRLAARRPACEAQGDAIGGGDRAGYGAVRARIASD